MKIAILGATGKTGGHALRRALEAGHHVRVLARDPAKLTTTHANLEVVKGDATKPDDCVRAVEGCDAVIGTLGPEGLGATTLRQDAAKAITDAMKAKGVKKIVWLSAFGVGDNIKQARQSSLLATLFMKTLLKKTYVDANAAEQVLFGSGLDFVLARPPGLTDKAATGVMVEVPEADKVPRLRCTRDDVAGWMLKAATSSAFDRQAVTIC